MKQQQYMGKTDNKATETSTSPKTYSMTDYFKCRYHLTLFRIGLSGGCSRRGGLRDHHPPPPPPPFPLSKNLFQISDKGELN